MAYTYPDMLSAIKYARYAHKWAETTVSIGLAVYRNGRERVFHFNRGGQVLGWETPDGRLSLYEGGPMSVSRDGRLG